MFAAAPDKVMCPEEVRAVTPVMAPPELTSQLLELITMASPPSPMVRVPVVVKVPEMLLEPMVPPDTVRASATYVLVTAVPCQTPVPIVPIEVKDESVATPVVALSVIVIVSGICASVAAPAKSVKFIVEVPTAPAVPFKNPVNPVRVIPAKVGESPVPSPRLVLAVEVLAKS